MKSINYMETCIKDAKIKKVSYIGKYTATYYQEYGLSSIYAKAAEESEKSEENLNKKKKEICKNAASELAKKVLTRNYRNMRPKRPGVHFMGGTLPGRIFWAAYYGSFEFSEFINFLIYIATVSTTPITLNQSTYVVHKPDKELSKFRRLWWEDGNIHPQAKWEEAELPYIIAEGITLEEYEERTDKFNVRGLWKKSSFMNFHQSTMKLLLVRSLSSLIRVGVLLTLLMPVSEKKKPMHKEPWPNIVVEVAYSESEQHVLEKVNNYWLRNHSRVHDAIVIKIDPVSEKFEPPTRMQAWHFCISDKPGRNRDIPYRTYFEFGTHDEHENPTNIQQGQCVIKISLSCCIMMLQFTDDFTLIQLYWILGIRTEFLRMYRPDKEKII
ncbi:hypothetical protein Glove_522g12 [Diversispora epigaea]|uniref:Uncharacterized protein n=1 Tax=Diversispora epigaea TaxID=1348612 RepID=A0A397GIS6_9GLOM|nr:hypothetical protein Glove_522g12 [Diversispora epigaea]